MENYGSIYTTNLFKSIFLWRHDTQHNDTQHNDTQHVDIQYNNIQHND